MSQLSFSQGVQAQVALLNEGKPLEALDQFFALEGKMFANGALFAAGAVESRNKQEPHILSAKSIQGAIEDLVIAEEREICAFRNKTTFVTADDVHHQIDGLCWQKWHNGRVIEEHYFDGEHMNALISDGILRNPAAFNPNGV